MVSDSEGYVAVDKEGHNVAREFDCTTDDEGNNFSREEKENGQQEMNNAASLSRVINTPIHRRPLSDSLSITILLRRLHQLQPSPIHRLNALEDLGNVKEMSSLG